MLQAVTHVAFLATALPLAVFVGPVIGGLLFLAAIFLLAGPAGFWLILAVLLLIVVLAFSTQILTLGLAACFGLFVLSRARVRFQNDSQNAVRDWIITGAAVNLVVSLAAGVMFPDAPAGTLVPYSVAFRFAIVFFLALWVAAAWSLTAVSWKRSRPGVQQLGVEPRPG